MRKVLLRYFLIWAPVLAASYLMDLERTLWQIVLWVLGFIFLLGWGTTTAVGAYHHPRQTLAFLLAYTGLAALLIYWLHETPFGSASYPIFDHAAGALSYRPLYMLYNALRNAGVFAELWTAGTLLFTCAAGFLCGVIYRWIRPNPYRPTFSGRQGV